MHSPQRPRRSRRTAAKLPNGKQDAMAPRYARLLEELRGHDREGGGRGEVWATSIQEVYKKAGISFGRAMVIETERLMNSNWLLHNDRAAARAAAAKNLAAVYPEASAKFLAKINRTMPGKGPATGRRERFRPRTPKRMLNRLERMATERGIKFTDYPDLYRLLHRGHGVPFEEILQAETERIRNAGTPRWTEGQRVSHQHLAEKNLAAFGIKKPKKT